ncbi:MAG: NADPH-dependent F420 reductase [Halodesulfurarchaeum sp.]
MRIALLGGTGDLGAGLALRWGRDTDHDLLVGSRDPERAREAATEYETRLAEHGTDRSIGGFENGMAAERSDVVVLAVSPYHLSDLLDGVADRLGGDAIVVSPAVGIERTESGFAYDPPPQGSVAALVRELVPEANPVVGAFHTLPAGRLASLEEEIDMDTLVVGDDERAVDRVRELAERIDGLGSLAAGPLERAASVESLTPLLLTLGEQNDRADPGIKIS